MDLEQIKAWLSEHAADADVVAYMQGLKALDIASVKAFLDTTAEGKAHMTAEKDKHFNKSLETWKTNNLEALVDAEVTKRNPEETPEMKEIKKLKAQLEEKDKNEKKQALLNKALQVAGEKKLPSKFIDRLLGEDEATTLANLDEFGTELEGYVNAQVEARFKEGGYQPPKAGGKDNKQQTTIADLAAKNSLRAQ